MRDIKFRVWSESRKKWLNECMFDMELKGAYDFSSDSSMRYNYKTDVIIEQFTGLKDVNGMEIYDGDIVQVSGNDGYYVTAKVVYECGAFWFYAKNISLVFNEDCDNMVMLSSMYIEDGDGGDSLDMVGVVGNIHQNPELLEKKQ